MGKINILFGIRIILTYRLGFLDIYHDDNDDDDYGTEWVKSIYSLV